MWKKTFAVLAGMIFISVMAQGPDRRPGKHGSMPFHSNHPLISVLDSNDFKPEERAHLKKLAAKDPRAFSMEMQFRFMNQRKAEAKLTLSLRKAVLEAKTPEEKTKAVAALRENLVKKADSRLAFHKKLLDETDKNLKLMQKRYEKLRKEYAERSANKEQLIEKEMRQILSDHPPKRLMKHANWIPDDPGKRKR